MLTVGCVCVCLTAAVASNREMAVKLVSAEGFEFVVDRHAAMVSNAVKNMLSSGMPFREGAEGVINLPDIRAPILEKVCQYMYYKLRWTGTSEPTLEFKVNPAEALELCMASDYLEI
mmetsp:Transcript_21788/g.67398  ORF Transcript_21788/g.67398 Transcript_21788/m.67398 type:complete len:117 (-) Transcript_21788:189-539(-)